MIYTLCVYIYARPIELDIVSSGNGPYPKSSWRNHISVPQLGSYCILC